MKNTLHDQYEPIEIKVGDRELINTRLVIINGEKYITLNLRMGEIKIIIPVKQAERVAFYINADLQDDGINNYITGDE